MGATLSPVPQRKVRDAISPVEDVEDSVIESGIVSESVSASSVIQMFGGVGKFKKVAKEEPIGAVRTFCLSLDFSFNAVYVHASGFCRGDCVMVVIWSGIWSGDAFDPHRHCRCCRTLMWPHVLHLRHLTF